MSYSESQNELSSLREMDLPETRLAPGMAPPRRLSILVPLYNEEEFITPLLEQVLSAPLPLGMEREIIVVDDGSRDGSSELAEEVSRQHPQEVFVLRHERNRGKSAAIRTAL